MKFSDICIITENVPLLTRFYEYVLQLNADGDEVHAALNIGGAGISIYSKKAAVEEMAFDFSKFWGSGNITIGLNVDDVDKEYERLKSLDIGFITMPTTHPWGARSFHFRDPDGNIICFRTALNSKLDK